MFSRSFYVIDMGRKKQINLVPDKNQFPLKVFDEIDGSLNVAYENGFAAVLANIVVGLAGDKPGAVK